MKPQAGMSLMSDVDGSTCTILAVHEADHYADERIRVRWYWGWEQTIHADEWNDLRVLGGAS